MWQTKPTKKSARNKFVAAALIIAAAPAYPQSKIDLPAQSLATTLARLAREGGVNILAADDLVAGRVAPAVSGQLTVREALDRLLQGTGLQVEQRDDKTYVIVPPKPRPSEPDAAAVALPAITVKDSAAATDTGFVADSTSTATRTDTPISETPQSVQVITQDVIKSAQLQSVTDALALVSGVTVQSTGTTPTVYIRGFGATTMTNGSPDAGLSNSLSVPMEGVERVEVLKGADSILSGQMSPSGVVNVVTKQPTDTPVHEVTLQAGSYGDWLGAVDLGGPVTQDSHLTYRFVLSAEQAGQSYAGFDGGKTLYVAPSVRWKYDGTDIVLAYQHNTQEAPPLPMTLVGPGGPVQYSGLAFPSGSVLVQSDTVSLDFKQKLGSVFQFESKTQYQATRLKSDNVYSLINGTADSAFFEGGTGETDSYGVDTDNHVRATFSLGPVKQTLLAGFDYNVYWTAGTTTAGYFYAPFPAPVLPPITGPSFSTPWTKSYSSNVYFQDQLSWGRLHVLASIARGTAWADSTPSQSAWSPNIGVLYQLTDSVAVYANAMRSFYPQPYVLLLGGGGAPPETGRSIEAGFKFSLMDDRLNVTADVYRAAVTNVAESYGATGFDVLAGGQVVRGAELSATGRVLPGLNVIANYTYSDEVQEAMGSTVPKNSGSLWMTYDLQGERWHGWGAGVGLQARTSSSITGVGYRIPGQLETDLSLYYKAKQWSAILGVKNLFDRTLYESTTVVGPVVVQPGRIFQLTGRYDF